MHESQSEENDRYLSQRLRMVSQQIEHRGLLHPDVLTAMRTVPREVFVPSEYRQEAYRDGPLPIGYNQTISQPYTVAFMSDALQLTGTEKVLEIGTGCGYQTAVLAQLAEQVHSVERIPELAEQARTVLAELGYENVRIHSANGTLGWQAEAPYDAILVTAGSQQLPEPYREQLKEGGRIVIPIGAESPRNQVMYRFTLRDGKWQEEDLGRFAFVPLIGEYGWKEGGCSQ